MNGAAHKLVTNQALERASSTIRALAHPLRLKLISFIDQNRKINVNKIYRTLKIEQSVVSQHLRILREENLVLAERNGKFIYYSLNYPKIGHINDAIGKFLAN